MVEIIKIIATSFKRSHAWTYTQCPQPCSSTTDPHLHQRLLDTHQQVWVSLLWVHCSFLLGPWCTSFCFFSPRVCFPVLCKFWRLYGVVNGDLFQEGLCYMLYPGLLHPEPLPLQQSTADLYLHRRHSKTVLSQYLWTLWVLVHTRYV